MESGINRAEANRRIRQEALREQLSNKGLLQQCVEISEKLADLDQEIDAGKVTRLKAAADIKLALVKKYLPDLKQSEIDIGGQEDNPLTVINKIVREIVRTQN